MMTMENTVEVLHLSLALLLLWTVVFLCLRSYRVDALRQRLFELRDELFDYADEGSIEFRHPAYTMLRTHINGMIRFAHRVSFVRLVLTVVFQAVSPNPLMVKRIKEWEEAVQTVSSKEVRERLLDIHSRMYAILARHMVTGSLTLMVMVIMVLAWALVHGVVKHFWEWFAKRIPGIDLLEAQAIEA